MCYRKIATELEVFKLIVAMWIQFPVEPKSDISSFEIMGFKLRYHFFLSQPITMASVMMFFLSVYRVILQK